jgi:hypothetical protein
VWLFKNNLPVCILKSVKSPFGVEYDQRVIIKFLWKEKSDTGQIAARLQVQFVEHVYQL